MGRLASELDVAAVLGEGGVIGEHIADFEPRASQLGMAELIAEAIHHSYPTAHPAEAEAYSIHFCQPDDQARLLSQEV